MSTPELPEELDTRLRTTLDDSLEKLRQEFMERLRQIREEVERQIREEMAAPEPAPEETEPALAGPPSGLQISELHGAVDRLGQASTQAALLTTLLAEATRFASRSALFITLSDEVRGWSSHGFGDDAGSPEDLHFGYSETPLWARLAEGRGGITLGVDECAALCARLDGSKPREGVLIPFVLRDRIAAALYADRVEEDDQLDLAALQLLTFFAAHSIETLPFRKRRSTVTLRLQEEAPAEEPGLELWDPEAIAAAAAAVDLQEVEEAPGAPEPTPVPVEDVEVEEVAEVAEEFEAEVEEVEALPVEEAAAAEPGPVEAAEPEEEAGEEIVVETAEEGPEPEVVELGELPEVSPLSDFEVEPQPPPEEREEGWAFATEEPLEVGEDEGLEVGEDEGLEAVEPEAAEEEEETIAVPAKVEPRPRPSQRFTGTVQVAPPPDLEGPGSAFAESMPSQALEQGLHEEARRLARLLVSEIKLYNEGQIEEGRRNRDLMTRLREEIERSRQVYDERVEPRIRADTNYFHDELVRILADGDPAALGS